jgi:hypothetical protein
MTFTFGTLPFAMRAIAEASVCFKNFQVITFRIFYICNNLLKQNFSF